MFKKIGKFLKWFLPDKESIELAYIPFWLRKQYLIEKYGSLDNVPNGVGKNYK
jgi:hypothetical protein